MKHFTDLEDIKDLDAFFETAAQLKSNPYACKELGRNKVLGMLFFNPSLRTRMSTQKAALQLGMDPIVMNFQGEGWALELEDGAIMNADKAEHIKEAAAVLGGYADVLAIRAFPSLLDRQQDAKEAVLKSFVKYAGVPIINMESATAHPLQALADAMTIREVRNVKKPKVVLSWAPHPKALPHAVPNSFIKMMQREDVDFCITHPEGYELNPEITGNTPVHYRQEEALENADFVYVKNWSSYSDYGKVISQDPAWTMTGQKLGKAHFMHCLPVRRNVVVSDEVLDGTQSLVLQQSMNRTWVVQAILKQLLEVVED